MKKTCPRCKCHLDIDAFGISVKRKDGHQVYCKACQRVYNNKHYAENPARRAAIERSRNENREVNLRRVLEYLTSHPCVDCGESDPIVLEFDHVRGTKDKDICTLLHTRSWESIAAEIEKCEVRCANCHRRKTAKQANYRRYAAIG